MNPIILFDGDCLFCNKGIQFIIRRDPRAYFTFSSLNSRCGKSLLEKYNIDKNIDSIILIKDGKVYTHSSAILQICKQLNNGWRLFYIFIIVPCPIRNFVYRWIAKNRYKCFGKSHDCKLPPPEIRDRFHL